MLNDIGIAGIGAIGIAPPALRVCPAAGIRVGVDADPGVTALVPGRLRCGVSIGVVALGADPGVDMARAPAVLVRGVARAVAAVRRGVPLVTGPLGILFTTGVALVPVCMC